MTPPRVVLDALAALLAPQTRVRVRLESGRYCPAQVNVGIGVTEYHFDLGSDGQWRLGTVVTYGNQSFVSGEGCDASGWVATPNVAAELDRLHGQAGKGYTAERLEECRRRGALIPVR